MPRVPEYEKRYQTRPLPGARYRAGADARSFGAGQATDIGRLGQAARAWSEFFEQEQLVTDRAELRDTLNQARTRIREYQNEVFSRKGADAINVYEPAEQDFRAIGQRLAQNLKTDEQKEAFATRYGNLVNRALDRTLSFQTQSREQYKTDTRLAHMQNVLEDAVADHNNPEALARAEAYTVHETRELNRGQSKAVVEKEVGKTVHTLYMAVLEAKMATSPKAALEFFRDNRKKFRPSGRASLEEGLRQQADRQWIRDKAIEISSSDKGLEQKLAMVDDIADSKRADEVRRRVKMRHAEQEKIKEDQYQAFVDEEFDNMKSATARGEEYQIPYGQLKRVHEVFFENYRAKMLGVDSKKVDPYKSVALYYDLASKPESELAKLDLGPYLPRLTISHSNKLISDKKAAIKALKNARLGVGAGAGKPYRTQTVNRQVLSIAEIRFPEDEVRQGWLISTMDTEINKVPENERTAEKIIQIEESLFKNPLTIDNLGWTEFGPTDNDWFGNLVVYPHELRFIEEKTRQDLLEENRPGNLKGKENLLYDFSKNMYYEKSADEQVVVFYDVATGAHKKIFFGKIDDQEGIEILKDEFGIVKDESGKSYRFERGPDEIYPEVLF